MKKSVGTRSRHTVPLGATQSLDLQLFRCFVLSNRLSCLNLSLSPQEI